MHKDIIANAAVENGQLKVSASVTVPTGGYDLNLEVQRYGTSLVCTVKLDMPGMCDFVTQAIEDLTLNETVDIEADITRVFVFIEPQRDATFDFEL